MYVPPYFKNTNLSEVYDFVSQHSFGILVSLNQQKILATHIPIELSQHSEGSYTLVGHIAKGNPQWKSWVSGSEVLAIFTGVHGYISASWYDHENVPTWNYVAVHIYGSIRLIEGAYLLETLSKQVAKYEQGSANPVSLEKMSQDFVATHLKGLVGFEISITDVQAAYKLSQNRDEVNHQRIGEALCQRGDASSLELADLIKKHQKKPIN